MPFPTTVDAIVDAPPVTAATRIQSSHVLGPQRAVVGPAFRNAKSDLYGTPGSTTVQTLVVNAAADSANDSTLILIPPTSTGMVAPAAPTVTVTGGAATTYVYFVIAVNAIGDAVASPPTTITNGPTTLDGTHFNAVSWGTVAGATSYRLVRHIVTGNADAVVFSGAATSFNDQGGATTTFSYQGNINNGVTYSPGSTFLDLRYLPTNNAVTRGDETNGFQSSAFKLGRRFDVGADSGSTLMTEAFLTGGADGAAVGLYAGATRTGGTRPMWAANLFISSSVAPVASQPNYGVEIDTANNSGVDATTSTNFDAIQLVAAGNAKSRFGIWITRLAAPAQYIDGIHIANNACSGTAINIDAVPTNVFAISANGPVVLNNAVWGESLTVSGQATVTKQAAANARLGVISGNPSLILDVTAASQEWVIDNMGSGTLRFYIDGSANNRLTLDNNGQLVTNTAAASTPLTLQHFAAASAPCIKLGSNVLTATAATAGTNGAVPAQVLGYIPIVWTDGTTAKIPVFKN